MIDGCNFDKSLKIQLFVLLLYFEEFNGTYSIYNWQKK